MAEELISSYIDRTAIKADTDFFLANLKAVLDAYSNLSGTKVNLSFSDGIKATSNSLNQLNENLKQTSATSQQATQALSTQGKTIKDLSGNYQDLVKQSVQNEIATKALREQRQLLNKDFKDGKITQEQYAAGLEDVKAGELELKVSNEQLSRAMKNLEKDSQAAEGSLDKLRAILNVALQAYDALSAEEKNSEIGKGVVKNIQDLTKEISEQEQATGRFQRNVGNYTGALEPLEKELQRVREELQKTKTAQENLIQTGPPSSNQSRSTSTGTRGPQPGDVQAVANYNSQLQQTSASVAELEKQEQLLNNIVATQTRGFSSAISEIRSLERSLFAMQEQGLATTEAFKEIQEKLAEAKREMREFKETQKLLSAEIPGIAAMSLAVKGISGAYAVSAGAAAIFADGNEKVEKELNKLVAIMTVLQGLQEVHELLEKKNTIAKIASTAATSALTAAQRLYTFVTEGSTVATVALRTALVSTGIGAVIVLLAAFISSMKNSTSATLEQLDAQNKLNDALKDFYEIMIKNNEELSERLSESTKELKEQLEIYQAMGKNQYDLFSVRKQIAVDEKKNAKEALQDLGLTEAGIERLRIQHDQLNEKLQKGLEFKEKAQKVELSDRQIKVIDAQNESYKKQIETLDGRIKRGDDLVKQIHESDQALKVLNAEETKFASEDIGKRRFENIKGQLEESIKFYSKVAELEGLSLNTRLKARASEFDVERQLIIQQRNFDLSNTALTENQRATIITNARRVIKELQEKENQDLLNIRGQYRAKAIEQEKQDYDLSVKEIAEYDKKKLDAELKAEQDRIKRRQDQDAINQANELQAKDKEYQDGVLSEEEYQKERFKIERYYSLKAQADIISDMNVLIKTTKEGSSERLDAEKKLAEAKKSIDDDLTKKLIDNREKLVAKEKEFANTIIGAVQSVVDNGYERQKNALQDQIDLIDSKKQKEVDAVNATTASEQDKAAKIAIINQRAEDQKAEIQKKQREQDIKKAQFDKLIGILQVGVNTQKTVADLASKAAIAKAEAGVLAANPLTAAYAPIAAASAAAIAAQIPLALAQGAIQAGLIAATPIPKYKTGTGYHPGGLMYAGDGGKSEIVIPPDGNAFTTPSIATLYDMPRGTVVLPDANQAIEQSFNMMYKPLLPALAGGGDAQVKMLSKKMDAVINAINGIPGVKVNQTWSGVNTSYENVSRQWEYINRNTQS